MGKKRTVRCITAISILVCLLLTQVACAFADGITAERNEGQAESVNQGFSLTMLDVGHGLALLIEADGEYLLYDGGGKDASASVVSYLDRAGITDLSYIIASHYDEDHIAGLIGAMATRRVQKVLCGAYEADTQVFQSFQSRLAACGAEVVHPVTGDSFMLGSAEIEVLSPVWYEYGNENNNSIAVRIRYGKFRCVITGDAEAEAEDDMRKQKLDLSADLLVVGHHGSASSSTERFIESVHPVAALISCGAVTEYGLPAEQVLNILKERGITLFRTDLQGTVTCYSDGIGFLFDTAPCVDWTPGFAYDRDTVARWKAGKITEEELWSKCLQGEAGIPQEAAVEAMMPVVIENGASEEQMPTIAEEGSAPASVSADAAISQKLTEENCAYVLNTNSMKFHYSWCNSVPGMSEKNKAFSDSTRDELISAGYKPCGRCKP